MIPYLKCLAWIQMPFQMSVSDFVKLHKTEDHKIAGLLLIAVEFFGTSHTDKFLKSKKYNEFFK